MMTMWVAFVADFAVAFDRDVHCVTDASIMQFKIEESDGANMGKITLTRKQTGYQILGTAQPNGVIVSESPTGLKEDAFVRARARIGEAPSDLFSDRQDLGAACAPVDIDAQILTWLKANCADGPETDLLFSDADPEDPETYLKGRSATVYVDPATHEIRLNDLQDGDRVVDLTGKASWHQNPPTDGPADDGGPVKRIIYALNFSFTQTAHGLCNIAGLLGYPADSISTYSPDFGINSKRDLPQGMISFADGGSGWNVADGGTTLRISEFESGGFPNGRKVRYYFQQARSHGDGTWDLTTPFTIDDEEWGWFKGWTYTFDFVWMEYDYSQEREETANFNLELPVQASAVVTEAADVVNLALKDLFEDTTAPTWDGTLDYAEGDRVTFGGAVYVCVIAHTATDFFTRLPGAPDTTPGTQFFSQHPLWVRAASNAALPNTGSPSFMDTDRGLLAAAHVFCRMRKDAIKRLRGRSVTLTYRWQDVADVRMTDEVRFEVPFGDGIAPVVGKVTGITRTWPSKSQPLVQLTVAIPFGDGTDDSAEDGTPPYDVDYVDVDYVEGGSGAFSAAGDVLWTWEADTLQRPIETALLTNPLYSVRQVSHENLAGGQYSAAIRAAMMVQDPRKAISDHPTRVKVSMLPLITEGVLTRVYDFDGDLLRGKRGIDLTTGGEP